MSRPHRLAFVCTANICRSPMAEGLARAYGESRGWQVECRSAGVMGLEGHPADPLAIKVCMEKGVDISDHRSGPVSEDLVGWADYILVMEHRHASTIREAFPEADEKILLLGTFGGVMEVADPFGGWRWRFRRARDEIARCVEAFMDRLPPAPRE